MAMTESEILARVDQAIRDAEAHSDPIQLNRRKALEYYSGEAVGDFAVTKDWESRFVSTDVADTIEWMLPTLIEIFASGAKAVEFMPKKADDELSAKQCTGYINYLFYTKNSGFNVLYTAIKNALLEKTGVVKVFWENTSTEKVERYSGLTQAQVGMLSSDKDIEIRQVIPEEEGTYSVEAVRTLDGGMVTVQAIPPQDFYVSSKATSVDDADFLCHKVRRTLSELKASGYKNVDQITSDPTSSNEPLDSSYLFNQAYASRQDDNSNIDKSQQRITIAECYMRIDTDEDGISEWRKIVRAGNAILENVECDGHPFVAASPIPVPHLFYGLSIADLTFSSQKIKTAINRALLDGIYRTASPRYAVVPEAVNMTELTSASPFVRVKHRDALFPLDLGAPDLVNGMAMLEYQETAKENRTGWTRYSQGTSSDALNQTATGVNIITNRGDMRIQLVARLLAENLVKPMFLKMLKLASQHQNAPEIFRLENEFVEVDPREWNTQFDVSVNVGLGSGNKDQKAAQLMQLLSVQKEALPLGIATAQNVYKAASLLADNLGFTEAELFTDPATQEQQGGIPSDPALEYRNQMLDLERQKLELQRMEIVEKLKLEREKAEAEIKLKQEKADADIKLAAMKIEAQTATQRLKLCGSNSDD